MSDRDTLSDILYNDLSQAFKFIDKDEDGILGVDDISYLLTTLGIGCNEDSISTIVRHLSDSEDSIRLPNFIELLGRALESLDENQPVKTLFRFAFIRKNFICLCVYCCEVLYDKRTIYQNLLSMMPFMCICTLFCTNSSQFAYHRKRVYGISFGLQVNQNNVDQFIDYRRRIKMDCPNFGEYNWFAVVCCYFTSVYYHMNYVTCFEV
uniref:EF-hand domain-containing protein n=1 Tax=Schistosoma mansoni TaxID=6183 RepID=A0A5K4F895_SCHMA